MGGAAEMQLELQKLLGRSQVLLCDSRGEGEGDRRAWLGRFRERERAFGPSG
jgi:hypothetical protein